MAEQAATGTWTADQLRAHFEGLLAARDSAVNSMLAERTRRFEERFTNVNERVADLDMRLSWRFEAAEKAVAAAFESNQAAIEKSEAATERRFESVNEFRAALGDVTHRSMPRAEADVRFQSFTDELHKVDKRMEAMTGKAAGAQLSWGYLVGAVGMAASLAVLIFAFLGS